MTTTTIPEAVRADTRERRGLELYRERGDEIKHLRGSVWSVPSCSREASTWSTCGQGFAPARTCRPPARSASMRRLRPSPTPRAACVLAAAGASDTASWSSASRITTTGLPTSTGTISARRAPMPPASSTRGACISCAPRSASAAVPRSLRSAKRPYRSGPQRRPYTT